MTPVCETMAVDSVGTCAQSYKLILLSGSFGVRDFSSTNEYLVAHIGGRLILTYSLRLEPLEYTMGHF